MRHARPDYERFQDPAGLVPDDEPVFLVRGQDRVGADTARAWADLNDASGGDPAISAIVRDHALRMDAWPKKKAADLAPAAASSSVVPVVALGEVLSAMNELAAELSRRSDACHLLCLGVRGHDNAELAERTRLRSKASGYEHAAQLVGEACSRLIRAQ